MSVRNDYVTEIDYTSQLNREQAPAWLSLATLWAGQVAPRLDRAFTLLELGCGHGGNAVLAAALFPHGQILANDFLPLHVESACRLRDEAGLTNLTVLPDSFSELALRDDLPACDIIVAHGVYSWVSAENQAHIRDIVRRLLKPGGLFFISYNAVVGWAPMHGLRQFLFEHAAQDSGPIQDRLSRGLDAAAAMAATCPGWPALDNLGQQVAALRALNPTYLVHEYLNGHWQGFHPSQMDAEMALAGLCRVGSAHPADAIDQTCLPGPLANHLGGRVKGALRELVGDIALNRAFRCDIFGRDVPALASDTLKNQRDRVRFVLAMPSDHCHPTAHMHHISLPMDPDATTAVVQRLALGPAEYAELASLRALRFLGPDQTLLQLTMMIQSGQVFAVPETVTTSETGAAALNRALIARAAKGQQIDFLAAHACANWVPTSPLTALLLDAVSSQVADPGGRIWHDIATSGIVLRVGDGLIHADQAGLEQLRQLASQFTTGLLPHLRSLGVAPG